MKIRVKVTSGSGALGGIIEGGTTVSADVQASDYEAAQATENALRILVALGVASVPPEEPLSEPATAESVGRIEQSRPRPSAPGDAVRIIFDDGSSRLFIDTGKDYFCPGLVGTALDDPLTVPYDPPYIASIEVLGTLGDSLGGTDGR